MVVLSALCILLASSIEATKAGRLLRVCHLERSREMTLLCCEGSKKRLSSGGAFECLDYFCTSAAPSIENRIILGDGNCAN